MLQSLLRIDADVVFLGRLYRSVPHQVPQNHGGRDLCPPITKCPPHIVSRSPDWHLFRIFRFPVLLPRLTHVDFDAGLLAYINDPP